MDVNAGRVISEGATLDDIADDIMQVIEHVANGQYCPQNDWNIRSLF